MEAITLPVYNTAGNQIDSIKLDTSVFDGRINTATIYQAVTNYRANQRKGLAATKTRGEVSGGGRKPWRQKGTGRARVGSIRSPLWRHGGVIFGPHPRDFSYSLPKKIRRLALKSVLCAKIKENNFVVLDNFTLEKAKTKEALKLLSNLKINPHSKFNRTESKHEIGVGVNPKTKVLLLLNKIDNNLRRSLRNIDFLQVNLAKDTHPYEVLTHQKLIITREGLEALTRNLKK